LDFYSNKLLDVLRKKAAWTFTVIFENQDKGYPGKSQEVVWQEMETADIQCCPQFQNFG
jgi:hypothetical protein